MQVFGFKVYISLHFFTQLLGHSFAPEPSAHVDYLTISYPAYLKSSAPARTLG